MFSISFKDVFNYLIFKHAETIQIKERERETGCESHSVSQSNQAEAPGPPTDIRGTTVQAGAGAGAVERVQWKTFTKAGKITHRTYRNGPLVSMRTSMGALR